MSFRYKSLLILVLWLFGCLWPDAALAQCSIDVDAGADISLCPGISTAQLSGSLTGDVEDWCWYASTGDCVNAATLSPVVNVTEEDFYVLQASAISEDNLIVNGDFEQGNIGFSSDYEYMECDLMLEGRYAILTQAYPCHIYWETCGDHTTGDGLMMLVNGTPIAGLSVWCQNINVEPNTTYAFSSWVMSEELHNPAMLQFSINDDLLGLPFTPIDTCLWQQFQAEWNAGTATTAEICIVNQNTILSGNDFALDDLSFSEICVVQDTVRLHRLTNVETDFMTISCDPADEGVDIAVFPASNGCDSIVTTFTTYEPLDTTEVTRIVCRPEEEGTLVESFLTLAGCDSTVITYFNYYPYTIELDITDASCADAMDGQVEVIIEGTTSPYSYAIDNGPFQSEPVFQYLPTGDYLLQVQDADGCISEIEFRLSGAQESLYLALLPGDTSLLAGQSIMLSAWTDFEVDYWLWNAASELSCTDCPNPVFAPSYSQMVVVSAFSREGCEASDSLFILVEQGVDVYIPNAFSPNADGVNDWFTVYSGSELVDAVDLMIFDRWGGQVFEANGIRPNEPLSGWNGHFHNQLMNPGVFVWQTKIMLADGRFFLKKGSLTLVR